LTNLISVDRLINSILFIVERENLEPPHQIQQPNCSITI